MIKENLAICVIYFILLSKIVRENWQRKSTDSSLNVLVINNNVVLTIFTPLINK
jgi:hypothetical protein